MNPNSDLWYLWEAFFITFLVLAIEVLITLRGNRVHRLQQGRHTQERVTRTLKERS